MYVLNEIHTVKQWNKYILINKQVRKWKPKKRKSEKTDTWLKLIECILLIECSRFIWTKPI